MIRRTNNPNGFCLFLTEEEAGTLRSYLITAAETFDKDVKIAEATQGFERLAEQFQRQACTARAFADVIGG